MLRRIGVLTSLAVTAAMFAGVTSAQATHGGGHPAVGDSVTCVFGGLSGQFIPAIPNTVPDALNGGTDIERGSYNFSGNADCVFERPGRPPVQATAVIGSAGFYDFFSCPTGFLHDLDSSGTFVDMSNGLSFGGLRGDPLGYEMEFRLTGGPDRLYVGPDAKPALAGATERFPPAAPPHNGVHGDDGEHGDPPSPGERDDWSRMHGDVVSNYVGRGEVQITPGNAPAGSPPNENCTEPSPPDVDGDTDEFRLSGYFTIVKYQLGADGDL